MTALELQSEYQSLVSRIANEDYETISKAVNALKKILSPNKAMSPNKTKTKKITRADLVIDPRIAAMTKGINSPESFDYKMNRIMISEKELNSYRLTSMEEPTDEMLAQIMHEAAEIYNRENQEAHDKLFANMQKMAKEQRQKFNLN